MPFQFNPPDGFKNKTAFPTTPASEDEFRAQMWAPFEQVRDYINQHLPTLDTPSMGLYRNAIINGNFDVWQRGTSFPNPSSGQYTADRFVVIYQNSGVLPNINHARTISPLGYVPGSTSGYWVHADREITGQGADDYYILQQRIERGTRLLAGNKITVSFWAKSTTPGKRIGVYASQNYGTGDTPSSTEVLSGGVITLSTRWQRYSVTINTSPISGKTFGTNNDDHISVSFVYAWGSSFGGPRFGASSAEGFGGDVHIDIAQVQVNVGDIALPFQPRSFAEELALCRRYYQRGLQYRSVGTFYTASAASIIVPHIVPMRIAPTLWKIPGTSIMIDDVGVGELTTSASPSNIRTAENASKFDIGGFTGANPYRFARLLNDSIYLDAEL